MTDEEHLTPSADRSLHRQGDSHSIQTLRPSLSVHQPVVTPNDTPQHDHHHHHHHHHHDHDPNDHHHTQHSRSYPSRGPSLWQIPPPADFLPLQPDIYPYLGRNRELPTLISRTSTGLSSGISAGLDLERNLSARRKSRVESSISRLVLGADRGKEMERGERLIGDAGFGWNWDDYRVEDDAIAGRKKDVKKFYERQNKLIELYEYVDKLLDSPLPRTLLDSYKLDEEQQERSDTASSPTVPSTPLTGVRSYGTAGDEGGSDEGEGTSTTETGGSAGETTPLKANQQSRQGKMVKRRPSYLYTIADEESPLMGGREAETAEEKNRIVRVAIYVNLLANFVLLVAKGAITVLTSSLSIIASLVDSVMDMFSTLLIWATSYIVQSSSSGDNMRYPVGRSRLEPIGVLIFSIIMITSFVQVGIEGIQRLVTPNKEIVVLTPWAIGIMASTVAIKGVLWLWCRLVKNSSVQALAADAFTDVVFNTLSILFPLLGSALNLHFLDALGGIFLSIFVIVQWVSISHTHIKNLTGGSASPELQSVLLYLVMRFARGIKQVTAINCYHAGDRINVEVDIVLDESMGLRDAHDLSEVLQWIIEALPVVERAWVHADYDRCNPIGHLR